MGETPKHRIVCLLTLSLPSTVNLPHPTSVLRAPVFPFSLAIRLLLDQNDATVRHAAG